MLSDEVEQLIAEQVRHGRAPSAEALLEEAVRNLIQDDAVWLAELSRVIDEGDADIAAGRFTEVATAAERNALSARLSAYIDSD